MQCSSAKSIADFMEAHEKIEAVYYPGLKSHSGHDIAAKQMNGFGGLLSFKVKGSEQYALEIANTVKIITQATSLGGTHTYIEHRASVEKEQIGRASSREDV